MVEIGEIYYNGYYGGDTILPYKEPIQNLTVEYYEVVELGVNKCKFKMNKREFYVVKDWQDYVNSRKPIKSREYILEDTHIYTNKPLLKSGEILVEKNHKGLLIMNATRILL